MQLKHFPVKTANLFHQIWILEIFHEKIADTLMEIPMGIEIV